MCFYKEPALSHGILRIPLQTGLRESSAAATGLLEGRVTKPAIICIRFQPLWFRCSPCVCLCLVEKQRIVFHRLEQSRLSKVTQYCGFLEVLLLFPLLQSCNAEANPGILMVLVCAGRNAVLFGSWLCSWLVFRPATDCCLLKRQWRAFYFWCFNTGSRRILRAESKMSL